MPKHSIQTVVKFAIVNLMETNLYDVAIVGGGASGLMCACQCARRGLRVVVVEKSAQVGRKILVSGNGRCNLTNAFVSEKDYNGAPQVVKAVLQQFSFEKCLSFFHELGVLTIQENAGRIFPLSGKSTAVVESLRLACAESGVTFVLNSETLHVRKQKQHFILSQSDGNEIYAKRCVLACGSCAYPQTGASKSGYELACSLGHHLIEPSQALCAVNVKEKAVARLQGIRVQARVTVLHEMAHPVQGEGELLFTAYGLSGPAILNVSRSIGRALSKGPVSVAIDLLPNIADKKKFLQARIKQFGSRTPKSFLAGMLHENISNLLIDFTGLRKNVRVQEWTNNTLDAVANALQAWPFTVLSLRPWTEAMVAAGGVNCAEINYNTMESRCCPGVYILGELLDVDGRSGGFNLHFAWGSGYVAAQAIAEE